MMKYCSFQPALWPSSAEEEDRCRSFSFLLIYFLSFYLSRFSFYSNLKEVLLQSTFSCPWMNHKISLSKLKMDRTLAENVFLAFRDLSSVLSRRNCFILITIQKIAPLILIVFSGVKMCFL